MEPRYKQLGNGDLYAPHRGEPPPPPDGYEVDRNDPFVFHVILRDCPHRLTKSSDEGCPTCRGSNYTFCDIMKQPVIRAICKDCDYVDSGIIDWPVKGGCKTCQS